MYPHNVAIIGAGPAGLTAGYLLAKQGRPVTVIEADPRYVGGISRTVEHHGYRFDIGGHRFFSKSAAVEQFWREILPDDFLTRPRSSRIYYAGKFFAYPLKPFEALRKLGPLESLRCVGSWLRARMFPVRDPRNFEDWVSNQFGRRLFGIFFRSYTEKVWGMSCREISADWAAQRIKGLTLGTAIRNAFLGERGSGRHVVKSLISSFHYPRLGPGMMWETCAAKMQQFGGQLLMGRKVVGCHYDSGVGCWRLRSRNAAGGIEEIEAGHVISSAPLRELAQQITPALPARVLESAGRLRYRDFLTVALILPDTQAFDDNWIYIHDPSVRVGRIQNFKSWSPELIPDPTMCCYGLEYFCFEGDGLWSASDDDLIALAKQEMETIGLAHAADVVDATVVRQPKAYPVYDDDYAQNVSVLRPELERHYPTLHLVGRNGMHKYNNQDHAMMTAMLCVENILAGRRIYDVWQVNQDAEYHETAEAPNSSASGLRLVPQRVGATVAGERLPTRS